jgi:hypothetical protein
MKIINNTKNYIIFFWPISEGRICHLYNLSLDKRKANVEAKKWQIRLISVLV